MTEQLTRRVLVVDDREDKCLEYAKIVLRRKPGKSWDREAGLRTEVAVASSVGEALHAVEAARRSGFPFQVVVTDLLMPTANGFDLIRSLAARSLFPQELDVIVVSQDVRAAQYATELGDLIAQFPTLSVWRKGEREEQEFLDMVWKGLWDRREPEPRAVAPPQQRPEGWREMFITEDPQLIDHLDPVIRNLARSRLPILIVGETGVGKEILAKTIHAFSDRRDREFLGKNVTALPEGLFEAELFGYEKGAFTGAVQARTGWIERQHQSTLLLDEIGELALGLQVKLLRVLEDRRVERIGAASSKEVDVRFLFATNRDLAEMVREGSFREDLYHRIAGAVVQLPPLRDRRVDIQAIGEHAWRHDKEIRRSDAVPSAVWDRLRNYDWEGNARELVTYLQRLALLAPDRVPTVDDLALVERLTPAASGAGLEDIKTFTQRAQHWILSPALNKASQRTSDPPVTRRALATEIARTSGHFWANTTEGALGKIYDALGDHAEECRYCGVRFERLFGRAPRAEPA